MKKSKFFSPVLPNITRFTRNFRKTRRTDDHEIEWLEDVDLSSMTSDIKGNLNLLEMMKNNSTANSTIRNSNDWSVLGLNGWEGDIHSPSDFIKQTRFKKRIAVEEKETSTPTPKNISNSDIFIARSNNPFGHSTKLELRY